MSDPPGAYGRADARAHWQARGAAWNRTSPATSSGAARYNRALIDGAAIRPGQRVLDLGSGTGQPALALSQAVGATGSVVALDHVPEMLIGTRRRMESAGDRNVTLVVADMVELPFAAASSMP